MHKSTNEKKEASRSACREDIPEASLSKCKACRMGYGIHDKDCEDMCYKCGIGADEIPSDNQGLAYSDVLNARVCWKCHCEALRPYPHRTE
jgi:hypothetical protein